MKVMEESHDENWAKSRMENIDLKERLRAMEEKQTKTIEGLVAALAEFRAERDKK